MEDDELDPEAPAPGERRLNIHLDPELIGGVYANFANISFSRYEFTLTFARIEHEVEEGDVPGAVVARINASPRFVEELIAALQDSWSKYADDGGHPEPARGAGPLSLALVPSYAVLCAAQAATAAAPARRAPRRGRGLVGLVAPAALLGAGVAAPRHALVGAARARAARDLRHAGARGGGRAARRPGPLVALAPGGGRALARRLAGGRARPGRGRRRS